ncbi:MAG: hypothetical protein PVG99_04355 [Desulfobacteraceae bacterium]|jgi:hypothetical protein
MLKKVAVAVVSLLLSVLPITAVAGSQSKAKTWNPSVKKGKVKAQRYTTKDGKKVLVMPDGKRYLLDDEGKRFMVDQNGHKIRVDAVGKIIKVGEQRGLKLRVTPGPLA